MPATTQPPLSDAKRQLLQRMLAGKAAHAGIPKRPDPHVAPQSFNQQQVWIHALMMGDKPAYNELITIHRHGPLDIAVLERALDELNRRHEILRTTFDMGDREPLQIIHSDAPPVRLPFFDLRARPRADRERESEVVAADARTHFDVTKLPLWRAILVRVDDDEYRLHMNLHQLVLDGVTVYRILLPELAAIYDAFAQGKPTPLPEPPSQYADFAVWQRTRLTREALEPHLAWWQQNLAGDLPRLAWPADRPRPAFQTYSGATEVLFLPASTVDPLRAYAERESATLYMALATGFFLLLHRYTGAHDLILGMPSASRSPETEGIMGYFLNLLPVRVQLDASPTFGATLRKVRTAVLDALEHGCVPLLHLIEALRPRRDPSRNPIFQIMLSLEPPAPPVGPAWDLTQAIVSSGSTKMDMYLNLDTRPDGLMAPIMYNPDLCEPATVRRMFEDWRILLEVSIAAPGTPVAAFRLTPQRIEEAAQRSVFGRLPGSTT